MRKSILQALIEYRPRHCRNESKSLAAKLNDESLIRQIKRHEQEIQHDETDANGSFVDPCASERETEKKRELEDMVLDYELNKQLATNKEFAKRYYAKQRRLKREMARKGRYKKPNSSK